MHGEYDEKICDMGTKVRADSPGRESPLPNPLTRHRPLQNTPSEGILSELGLVVILVCHNNGYVHGLLYRRTILGYSMAKKLWAQRSGVSWCSHLPRPCACLRRRLHWVLKATHLILHILLPVQWHVQQQPARLLLYGKDSLRGTVGSRPCDAVEDLGASILIRFELETDENDS